MENSGVVSMEVAQALKDAGYPQDQWPQMVWADRRYANDPSVGFFRDWEPEYVYTPPTKWAELHKPRAFVAYFAAPTPLQALEWLADNKAIEYRVACYHHNWETRWALGECLPTAHDDLAWHTIASFRHPTDLILAILKHLQEAQ